MLALGIFTTEDENIFKITIITYRPQKTQTSIAKIMYFHALYVYATATNADTMQTSEKKKTNDARTNHT